MLGSAVSPTSSRCVQTHLDTNVQHKKQLLASSQLLIFYTPQESMREEYTCMSG